MTGFIIANYSFFWGIEGDFINIYQAYQFITIVQILDIFLNFFKIPHNKSITNGQQISQQYFKSYFIPDIIAVVPYPMFKPSLTPFRFLKMIKIPIYNEYYENFVVETFSQCLNPENVQLILKMNGLLLQLGIVSHFLACIWVHIGIKLNIEGQTGWLHTNMKNQGQLDDFFSSYMKGIYWVIYTFATVGYGDVVGVTQMEYLYNMLVIMIGICFFGYMIGTFQQIMKKLTNKDDYSNEQEQIDHWLMRLHQINNSRHLQSSIYQGVREFYNLKYKQDAMQIQHTQFFIQLKPRLQKQVLDVIFNQYYQKFSAVFIGCNDNFRRQIIKYCEFEYFQNYMNNEEHEEIEWPQKEEKPIIQQAGQISKKIYFIISGPIYQMDQNSFFEYTKLESGTYFGDVSVFLNEPNEYNYCYDPYGEKSIQFLSINSDEFIRICRQNPIEYEILLERAYKRKQMHQNYKTIQLISIMKSIYSNSETIIKNFDKKCPLLQRVTIVNEFEKRLKLFELFISHYDMERINFHIQKFDEEKLKNKDTLSNDNLPKEFNLQQFQVKQKQSLPGSPSSESTKSLKGQKDLNVKIENKYLDMFTLKQTKKKETSTFGQYVLQINNIEDKEIQKPQAPVLTPQSTFGRENETNNNQLSLSSFVESQKNGKLIKYQIVIKLDSQEQVMSDDQNNQNQIVENQQINRTVEEEKKEEIKSVEQQKIQQSYFIQVNNVDLSDNDSDVQQHFKDYETSNESKKESKTLNIVKPYTFTREQEILPPQSSLENQSNVNELENSNQNQDMIITQDLNQQIISDTQIQAQQIQNENTEIQNQQLRVSDQAFEQFLEQQLSNSQNNEQNQISDNHGSINQSSNKSIEQQVIISQNINMTIENQIQEIAIQQQQKGPQNKSIRNNVFNNNKSQKIQSLKKLKQPQNDFQSTQDNRDKSNNKNISKIQKNNFFKQDKQFVNLKNNNETYREENRNQIYEIQEEQKQIRQNKRYHKKIQWRNEDEKLEDYLKTRKNEVKNRNQSINLFNHHQKQDERDHSNNQKSAGSQKIKKLKVLKECKISQYLEGGNSSKNDSSIDASESEKSQEENTFSHLIHPSLLKKAQKSQYLSEQKKRAYDQFQSEEINQNNSDQNKGKNSNQNRNRRKSISQQFYKAKLSNISGEETFRNMTINKNMIIDQLKIYYQERIKKQKKIDQQNEIEMKNQRQQKSDEDTEQDISQIKNPFKKKISENQSKSNDINYKKIQHFDSIIDEYVNVMMIKYDQDNDRSSKKQYDSLLDLINKRNHMDEIQPQPFFSALKARQFYAFKNQIPYEKMDTKEVDKKILIEQKQHLETFQKFISLKIEKLKHMNKKIDEDQQQGKEIFQAMNKQIEINQMFQSVYDQQVSTLQSDLKKAAEMISKKMNDIHVKLDAFAWKKQVEKHKKNLQDRANQNSQRNSKISEINTPSINEIQELVQNKQQQKSKFYQQSEMDSENSSFEDIEQQ